MIVGSVLLVLLASMMLTGMARRYAVRAQVVDVPTSRSSHVLPTPRGGGVAFVVVFLLAVACLYANGLLAAEHSIALIGAGAAVAIIGFADDHRHVPAAYRLLVHAASAAWIVYWLGVPFVPSIFGSDGPLPIWLSSTLLILFVVWTINLYNFMDGIDGIASLEAISVALGAAWLSFASSPDGSAWLPPLLLAAAVAGFLVWNLPPARIFMGDVGSGFLGVCLATLALQSFAIGPEMFAAWMVLLAVFVVDSTFTVLRRLVRGRPVYQAHRSHAYQHAAARFGHRAVILAVSACNVLVLLPLAWLVATDRLDAVWGLTAAYLPLVAPALYFRAGLDS